ncbi:MAG: efflux RND transporter periplasmic adaptor subunit [Burkholderiaceae bacterium]
MSKPENTPSPDSEKAQAYKAQPRGIWRRIGGFFLSLSLAGLAVALTAGGTFLLHSRAQMADEIGGLPPTIVTSGTVNRQNHYEQQRRFSGRVESARRTDLAFELPGRLIELAVDEGQRVNVGDVLATLDRSALELRREEQEAARRALQSDRRLAVLESRRQKRLKGDGYASGRAFDEARLKVAGLGARIEQIDAALRGIDLDLDKTILRAPFDATVGQLNLEAGAIVSPGTPVLTVFEQALAQVRVGVPQRLASGLKAGQELTLMIADRQLPARLVRLRPDLNAQTQTVSAIVEFSREALADGNSALSTSLLFGQTAQLQMNDRVEANGFWIPLTALREGQRGLWTMTTLTPDPRDDELYQVGSSAVEVLHADGDRAFVRGGPEDGALYVTTGLHRLSRGERVRIEQVDGVKPSAERS